MDKRLKAIAERFIGPTSSVVFNIIIALILGTITFQVVRPEHQVEAKILEIEEVDLEKFDKQLEQLPDLPQIESAVVPEAVEKPPEVENVVPEQELASLDILSSDSPLVMKGLYAGRLSAASRRQMLKEHAGTFGELTEKAVIKALRWLKEQQRSNGSWEGGEAKYTPGITGLGLLTFLAHGETTASEEFGGVVEKAVKYLIGVQDESGAFFDPDLKEETKEGQKPTKWGPNMYAPYWHAMATYAVSEAYGLMRIPELKPVMEKAAKIIVDGQQPGGGWNYGYTKETRRDTSILGWQVQALKAANIGGAEVEGIVPAMEKAIDDLRAHQQEGSGVFWYSAAESDTQREAGFNQRLLNNTGIAVLSLELLGHGLDKETKKGLNALKVAGCSWQNPTEESWHLYGWYYITQAKFHQGGADWTSWNNKFAKVLTDNQREDGHWEAPLAGAEPCNEQKRGFVYTTTLAALTLQVYYRFLPTYQAKAVEVKAVSAEAAEDDVVIQF